MHINVIVHHEPEGYWAEVPAVPGCVSQGDTLEELKANVREAIEGCRLELAGMVELVLVLQ